ncbi:hypothetical protein F4678DRAFT_444469 [Xylaria arbuscula]|nr:hypothetical protein F4678DRAFT_444469 [Xylaria arbuscula]
MFKKAVAWRAKKDASKTNVPSVPADSTSNSIRSSSVASDLAASHTSNTLLRESVTPDPGPLGLNVVYTPDHARKADIVFVHGLGGSSRWTWSKNKEPHLFWPLTFLPLEPDLCLSRILTFGYDASFQKSTSANLSVLDFAKDLLFDLKYAKDSNMEDLDMGKVPLIFVVHSMGGLVVKEAYMQGQHDPEYEDIIKAVCAITFIATPHRGTNLAQVLNRILDTTVLVNSKQYVADLIKNSPTLQKLNEQFRHICPRLEIVSFYETQPTPIGIKSARLMVLEKETSVLGYPGEVSKALNADHHGVCKPVSPNDQNYIVIRNILKSLVSKIISKDNAKKPALSDRRALLHLKSLLALPDLPSVDYIFFRDRWTQGTCGWITHEEDFVRWRESMDQQPHILWISGDAATGKSVLSSFIVNRLVEEECQCHYFYVRYGDRLKRTISLLLRSLAFQLAQTLPELMEKIRNLGDEAFDFEKADYRVIWNRVFKSLILKSNYSSPVYWVIDGLDENEDPPALVKLLLDIPSSIPLRVLVTSRRSSDIVSAFERPRQDFQLSTIKIEGHLEDIRQHIDTELRVSGSDEFRRDVQRRILEGSQNNFLWARLAVTRVNQCYVSTDVDLALNDFPVGMEALYERMAASVEELPNPKSKALAMRIIQCATCALRALSIEELSQALGEVAHNVLDLPRAIMDLCGGFVVSDNDGNVATIHQTARDYLLGSDATERPLRINRQKAHKQIFLSALQCLMSNSLRAGLSKGQKLGFEQYAAEFWSIHLIHTAHDDEECAAALKRFLTGRWSLTWIHVLASSGQLRSMTQASKNLSRYASKRGHRDTGAGTLEHEFFQNWAVDMIRIPGKFGQVLRRKPDSIYTMIPPFCPRSSPVYQQFGRKEGVVVNGLLTEKWDDSLARMSTGNAMASAIDASGSVVAALNASGSILLHDSSDFRHLPKSPLEHGERVTRMQLNSTATLIVTYGYRTVKVWDIKLGECTMSIASIESKTRPLSLLFSEDNSTLMVGTDDRRVRSITLTEDEPTWQIVAELDEEEIEGQFLNSASHMALSRDGSMVVVGYRRYPVSAWELDGPMHIGHCRRTNDNSAIREIRDLSWHPQEPEVFGLNFEGTVFKWAPYEDIVDEVSTGAAKLCLSKDGELLATGDSHGRIKLYTTDGFVLLYQLTSQYAVFGLTFSPDSRRLYDVRGYHANAWEPTALAKFKASPNTNMDSLSEYDASLATDISIANLEAVDPITALSASPNSQLFCSGSAKGVVCLHDVRSAKLATIYTSRAKFTVDQIGWSDDSKFLCFTDASKQITVMAVMSTSDKSELAAEQRAIIPMRNHTKERISQILFQPGSGLLLVCTASQLHTVSLETLGIEQAADIKDMEIHQWIQHPRDATLILGLGRSGIRVFDWNLVERGKCDLISRSETFNELDEMRDLMISKVLPSQDNKHLLLHMVHHKQSSRPKFCFLETDKIPTPNTPEGEPSPIQLRALNTKISSQISSALSFLKGDRLIFISTSFSICSMRLSWTTNGVDTRLSSEPAVPRERSGQSLAPGVPQRRLSSRGSTDEVQELFALPGDWVSQDSLAICEIMAREKSFICPRNGEVAIVKSTALA